MQRTLLLILGLLGVSTSAPAATSVPLTRVCVFRFAQSSDLEKCTSLAEAFAKITKLQQRMYQPQSAEWNPNTPLFETPTVYWVQKFDDALQRQKARVLDKQLNSLARSAAWHTCFDANIVSGDFLASPVTIAGVNNYFPNQGDLANALAIRLKVSEMMTDADACPPYLVVPAANQQAPFGFLAFYELKDEVQAQLCHQRQYAPAIIKEVNKITPFLSGFARMRSSLVYSQH